MKHRHWQRQCWVATVATAAPLMTSSDGNISCVIGPLCEEFIGHRWIPLTKASDAVLRYFFSSAPENGRVNNRDASDLRRHRINYDVTVIPWHKIRSIPARDRKYRGNKCRMYTEQIHINKSTLICYYWSLNIVTVTMMKSHNYVFHITEQLCADNPSIR